MYIISIYNIAQFYKYFLKFHIVKKKKSLRKSENTSNE